MMVNMFSTKRVIVNTDKHKDTINNGSSNLDVDCSFSQFNNFSLSQVLDAFFDESRDFISNLSRKMVRGVSSCIRACLVRITCKSGVVFNSQSCKRLLPPDKMPLLI